MKMAKASEKDIDAAGDAMSVLDDMSRGYYPKRDGDECDDLHFDPEDQAHLSTFYRLMTQTLDASPGWPGRVIGGMCYVILYDKNRIVAPDADTLELHPRFVAMEQALRDLIARYEHDGVPNDSLPTVEAARAALAPDDSGAPTGEPRLSDEDIAAIAERMEATDPSAAFWREFARAVEAHVAGVSVPAGKVFPAHTPMDSGTPSTPLDGEKNG